MTTILRATTSGWERVTYPGTKRMLVQGQWRTLTTPTVGTRTGRNVLELPPPAPTGDTTPIWPEQRFATPTPDASGWEQLNNGTVLLAGSAFAFAPTAAAVQSQWGPATEPIPLPRDDETEPAEITFTLRGKYAAPATQAAVFVDWFTGTAAGGDLAWLSPRSVVASTWAASAVDSVVTFEVPAGADSWKPGVMIESAAGATTATRLFVSKFEAEVTATRPVPDDTPTPPTPPPTPTPGGGLVAGGSFFNAYQEIYAGSVFLDDLRGAPPRDPGDKFRFGRAIGDQGDVKGSNVTQYNITCYLVDNSAPRVAVNRVGSHGPGANWRNWKSGYVPEISSLSQSVPWPPNPKAAAGTDGSMAVLNVDTGELWEFWQMNVSARTYSWMGYTHNVYDTRRGVHDIGSVAASALQTAAVQIGIDEAIAGVCNHVIGLELVRPKVGISWPADQYDGWGTGSSDVEEGTRLILDPAFDPQSLPTKYLRMVATTVQKYGFIVTDKSGLVAVRGEAADEWMQRHNTGTNPWNGILEGVPWWDSLTRFPWDRLIALPKDYGKP